MSRTPTLEAAAALVVVAAGLGGGCRAHAAGGREPVIFVHGCPPGPPLCVGPSGGSCTNEQESGLWQGMVEHFKQRGYAETHLRRFVASGPACDSTITQSRQLADFVRAVRAATGAAKVDLVAHSMGALTARLFILEAGGEVDDFVSIGGGNHGSQVASAGAEWQARFGAPAYEGAKEMTPPYACQGQSAPAADVQFTLNGCLTPAGRAVARDETPGSTRYLSIRNSVDEIVSPRESACLNQRRQNDCSDASVNVEVSVPPGPGPCGPAGCPGHVAMVWDPAVMQMTYEFTAGDR